MSKQCPRCGYQPNFWKNKPWGYYCPDCGQDLNPGKALFKPWKRLAYLVSGITRVDAVLLWLFCWQLFSSKDLWFLSASASPFDDFFRNWLRLFVAAGFLPFLASLVALPFNLAQGRLARYNALLKHGRDESRSWFSGPRVILLIILLMFVLPALLGGLFEFILKPLGVDPIHVFGSPYLLLPLAVFIGWHHFKQIRASYQPLHPLQWNPDKHRFEELKPEAVPGNS